MPFNNPTHTTRRHFLASFLSLAAAPAKGFSLFGKQRARDLGKVYEYLKDVDLRIKETGKQRIMIKSTDFSGEEFSGEWGHFDFVDCEFQSQYLIGLDWLVNCTFTNCYFNGIFGFGNAENVSFLQCKFVKESNISFLDESKDLIFDQCQFINHNADRNHRGAIFSDSEVFFIKCRGENFALYGYKKLVLRNFVSNGVIDLGTASPGEYIDKSQMPYSDFLLEDCDFTRGLEIVNPKFNNFTMRNCKVDIFKTARSVVLGDMLIENIKKGHLDLSNTDFKGKLTVRNCSFFTHFEGFSFWCRAIITTHTLIEDVICGTYPTNVSGSGEYSTEESRLPVTINKSFIIRNCDIPHLHVDWAQTEHLRIENCKCDTLLIRNGRIGKLEIIDCSLKKLDVSNTQVQEQDVRVPAGCETLSAGSNLKWSPR
ncbi:MAG: hypothetical protein LBQ75_03910 [Zoogloeaceae bacterium]|nr:hypothetical protein [Zoogloeaceae bacterium]